MSTPRRGAVGRSIRKLRESRGLTGEQLAARIGSDKGTISRIERGEAGLSVERLQKIAAVLGVPVSELLAESNRPAA
jgi:transcriptional regulator with XRE-family HTH domain